MPFNRYSRRGGPRLVKVGKWRRFKRRQKRRGHLTAVGRVIQAPQKFQVNLGTAFPKQMKIMHRYAESVNVTSTTGILQNYNFTCNGMFDPDITGSGHQPLYFDQMTAIYDHYTVIASKIYVECVPSATSEDAFRIAILINDDTTTTPTDMSTIIEQAQSTYRTVPANANNVYSLNKSWSAKKTFGGSVLGNDNLQGTAASNPTEQSYFTLSVQGSGANTVVANFNITIEYIAIWEELKDIAAS